MDFTGQAAKLDELLHICRKNGLFLIEDAAHSIGTKYKGKPVGSIADMTTFSFHPVKTVTGGEGARSSPTTGSFMKNCSFTAPTVLRETLL